MRNITHIVLHCTATQPNATVAAIQRYWREEKKWNSPGYHYIIDASGKEHQLLDESRPSNGVAGRNSTLINVAYIGGIDRAGKPFDTRTPAQIAAMIMLLRRLRSRYPNAAIVGHRDFPNVHKACPSFDVATWLRTINF